LSTHVLPKRTYYIIFALLMVFTYATWQVAYFDLGPMNTVVAMGIAVVKATLVLLFFMHVKYSTRLTWVVAAAGFFWLGILLVLMMTDYLSRGLLPIR
jgi:cytochrome c oxidase subunit 4